MPDVTGMTTWLLQRYWRLTRALTLGAQAVVIDPQGRVLLVRHGYRPGWHFPGGGVEFGETVETAVVRELREETGVVAGAHPRLFGLYAHFTAFPGDHIALFVIDSWSRPSIPAPNHEIAEQGFFARDALPTGVAGAVAQRLTEIIDGTERSAHW
jgi:ADP-ribose pyrophosphatase YjhB (NUDIX family)